MKKNEIILILVSIAILVLFWIGFNVYHNSVTSTISEAMTVKINPINPNFDTKTIEELKKRRKVSSLSEIQTPSTQVSPTPIASSSSIIVTPTPLIIVTPIATLSGGQQTSL